LIALLPLAAEIVQPSRPLWRRALRDWGQSLRGLRRGWQRRGHGRRRVAHQRSGT
jgi:hypothetical protein